jgi:hypothetical protein
MTAEIFLIGDSHIIAIANAAQEQGRQFYGGPIGEGRLLEKPFYTLSNRQFQLSTTRAEPIKHKFLALLDFDGPILCTAGFNSHRFARQFGQYCKNMECPAKISAVSQEVFTACVLDARKEVLGFYRMLQDHHKQVFFTCSPQRVAAPLYPLLTAFETVLIKEVSRTGAVFVDVRDQVADDQGLKAEYARSQDTMHGNIQLGHVILDRFDAQSKLQ